MRKTILIAASAESHVRLQAVLKKTYDLLFAFSAKEAKRFVMERQVDLAILSVSFDKGRMLELLQFIRSEERLDHLQMMVIQTDNSARMLDVKREAEALGARGFLQVKDLDDEAAQTALTKCVEDSLAYPRRYNRSAKEVVMVADVDPFVRNLVSRYLTESGYEVVLASDGYEALDAARKSPPKVLLADMLLPRLDGLALCRLLKSDSSTEDVITVIVFSVLTGEERALKAGADAFMRKPFEKARLLNMLREKLGMKNPQEIVE